MDPPCRGLGGGLYPDFILVICLFLLFRCLRFLFIVDLPLGCLSLGILGRYARSRLILLLAAPLVTSGARRFRRCSIDVEADFEVRLFQNLAKTTKKQN